MAVEPQHRIWNEAERADWNIYDDFKLKKNYRLHGLYKNISALLDLKWIYSYIDPRLALDQFSD